MDANMLMLYTSDIVNNLSGVDQSARKASIDDAHGRWLIPGISGAYTQTPLFDRPKRWPDRWVRARRGDLSCCVKEQQREFLG